MKNSNSITRIDAGPMAGGGAALGFVHVFVQVPGVPRLGFEADPLPDRGTFHA